MEYEFSFLRALILTIIIETSVLFFLFSTFFRTPKISYWIILLTGLIATFATLPYLWFIFPLFIKSKMWYIIGSEIFAILIESAIILGLIRTNYSKAIIVSIVCNMASFLIGLLFNLQ